MRILSLFSMTLCLALPGGAALAWGDMYRGDATNDPNSNFLIHTMDLPNECPAGLQPVTLGGVVCCGTPNAGAYVNRPGASARRPAPRAYAPVGEKGVIYR